MDRTCSFCESDISGLRAEWRYIPGKRKGQRVTICGACDDHRVMLNQSLVFDDDQVRVACRDRAREARMASRRK